ncbi:MAG: GspE/PulE family protein [Candidatus Nitronauta litoralis]|uniref:GspE/PulE family protein n=1 Tax=Candidatus Nitronauta litoralis TaxID=2705533 RepID=A0A7T0BYD2_9BACT|nr:MAG: GspE/PulE family protein [Candidatus Nitronauta litoralis]
MATTTAGEKVKSLTSRINSASDLSTVVPNIIDELKELFESEAIVLFSLERATKQLVSRNHLGNGVGEIRQDISPKTIVGHVVTSGKALNISDVNSKAELAMYNPNMDLGSALDGESGFTTKSLIVAPLAHNKKLVGVIEIINKKGNGKFSDEDFKTAKDLSIPLGLMVTKLDEVSNGSGSAGGGQNSQEKMVSIVNAIHSAKNVDEILIELKPSILELFDAELMTIYAVDQPKNEIYSKMKSGDTVNEIRVPIAPQSIAGCVAMAQKAVVIKNVYDQNELQAFHSELSFDSSWDKKSGFKTQNMLVVPMMNQNRLMGVLQLINKHSGAPFTSNDEKNATSIAETIGLAFFNQTKFVQQKPTKFSYLINNGILSDTELNQAIGKARRNQIDIEQLLLGELKISRNDLGKSLENFYNVSYVGYEQGTVLPSSLFEGLNLNFLQKNAWVPIGREGKKVTILIDNPLNQDKIQNIKLIFAKHELEFKVSLKADIHDFLTGTLADDTVEEDDEEGAGIGEMSSLLDALQSEKDDGVETIDDDDDEINAINEADNTIIKLVNKILIDAYDQGISDIHLEPGVGKDNMLVRYRKDGSCRIYQEIPPLYKQAILSRIKIMSKLDIAERRLPQDGKIKMKYGRKDIEYRVATCPTVGGNEDAVLRILAASKPIPLEGMNFAQRNLELIQRLAAKPYGLILVVGPTGSGKTTTLHSTLGFINKPDRKIWTAEDPVEITQRGLRQVQMHPKIGLNFARAMKSFLRADPDVIMVGEMRDAETCAIGLEASLTGHLVFSTLHTNSAPETITRLLDMGMNPLNFADALLLIVAQRLVRTLCKKCKEDYHPGRDEYDTLVKEYGSEELFMKNVGIEYTDDLTLKGPKGCDKCGNTGYAGRTGLHELLEGTDEIKRMIMKKSLVEELREQALSDGMTTLKQDGIKKIFKGDCDLKQVMAVCIV